MRFTIRAFPGTSAVIVTGLVPLALAPRLAMAGVSGVTIAGNVPQVSATGHRWAPAGLGSIAINGASPIVTADASVVLGPSSGAFVIAGILPVSKATDRKTVLPLAASLLQSGFAAYLVNPKTSAPGFAAISATGRIPVVSATAGRLVRADVGTITATGFAPSFIAPQTLWPSTSAIGIAGQAPGSQAATSALPGTSDMAEAFFAPGLEITEDQFARIGAHASMTIAGEAPFLVLPRTHWPEPSELDMTGGTALLLAIIPVALMNFIVRPGGEMMGQIVKHPWAEVRVSVDWGPYITRQQTQVTSSTWIETTTLGVLLDGPFISNSVASVEIGGGNPATVPIVENRVLFADGARDVFRVRVQVASIT
jgi:hypothetical protein